MIKKSASAFKSTSISKALSVVSLSVAATVTLMHAPQAMAEETESPWFEIFSSDKSKWHAKRGTGGLITVGKEKNSAYGYVLQVEDVKERTFEYSKVFVDIADCKRGYGHFYYNDMEGKFKAKEQFVRFGFTVLDDAASLACASWDENTKKQSRARVDNPWIEAATAEKSGAVFKVNTDLLNKNRSHKGRTYLSAVVARSKDNRSTYSEYLIPKSACSSGVGKAYELDFSGSEVSSFDFAVDAATVGGAIASTLCKQI